MLQTVAKYFVIERITPTSSLRVIYRKHDLSERKSQKANNKKTLDKSGYRKQDNIIFARACHTKIVAAKGS